MSRPYFVRDGYFNDVDVALHDHIGKGFGTVYGLRQYALISAEFTFKGQWAHAATAPWNAKDALDAVVLMDIGWDKLREHLEPTQRSHRVITNGGDQPNVIPNKSSIWWFFREATAEKTRALFEKAKRIAEGAAIMTDTSYSVNVLSAVWPTRANRTLAEVIQSNVEQIGMPQWSEEEQGMVHELQAKLKIKPTGMPSKITPAQGMCAVGFGQRFGRSFLGRADRIDHVSVQYSRCFLPSLVGRGVVGDFRRAQRRGGRRQGHGGVGAGSVLRSEAGCPGQGNF